MKYKYSVIIPVYNAEKTICRCLDSLLTQNYNMAEIILVNDGSKDNSGSICKSYAEKNDCIIYIEQENSGASVARNAGLARAKGEYITFVDSDDYVLDGYFSALDYSEDDFIVFSYQSIRPKGLHLYQFSNHLLQANSNTDRIIKVLSDRIVGPCNKRFKKSIIEKNHIRFKSDLVIGEDFIFGLEYMLLCKSSSVKSDRIYCVDETNMQSVTRAEKYDKKQFLKMYEYAFDIASKVEWNEMNKKKLFQTLDFLYCRTGFACTERYINDKRAIRSLIAEFSANYKTNISPINIIHAGMRLCIKYNITLVFMLIARVHILANAIKRKVR